MKFSYKTLENILKSLGYSDEQTVKFRENFSERLLEKIGVDVVKGLDGTQKHEFVKILSQKDATVGQVMKFVEGLGLKDESARLFQKAFDDLAIGTLENILKYASKDQRKIIEKALA